MVTALSQPSTGSLATKLARASCSRPTKRPSAFFAASRRWNPRLRWKPVLSGIAMRIRS
jgi:hypothetical protein